MLGLCSLLLIPTTGPACLILAPFAWHLGHADHRRRRDQRRLADPSAEIGRVIGKAVTLLTVVTVALALKVLGPDKLMNMLGWA